MSAGTYDYQNLEEAGLDLVNCTVDGNGTMQLNCSGNVTKVPGMYFERRRTLKRPFEVKLTLEYTSTHSLVYKGWLIRDGFLGLVKILENLRDDD